MSLFSDLKDKCCACSFDLPAHEWPIDGYPAWVVVLDVDMPLVQLVSAFGGSPIWVNASKIKTIRANNPEYLPSCPA